MYNHCADFTSLTDIDDGITFILPRQAFYQEERVTKTYLEKECILCVRHDQLTPLINRLDQVQQTKYERLQLVEIPV